MHSHDIVQAARNNSSSCAALAFSAWRHCMAISTWVKLFAGKRALTNACTSLSSSSQTLHIDMQCKATTVALHSPLLASPLRICLSATVTAAAAAAAVKTLLYEEVMLC
jgi:hypothetical protein